MTDIRDISGVIKHVDDVVDLIAAAVEKQAISNDEIVHNITQASTGVQEINANVAQSSEMTTTISADIAKVNQASEEMTASSFHVKLSAEELSRLSERLFGKCLFCPISLLDETFNPRNTCCIPPVKCLIRLELEETKQFPNSL